MRLSILGAGFIGSSFIEVALKNGHILTVLDRKSWPNEFIEKVNWIQGDFFNEKLVQKAILGADIVLHFISSTVPGDCVDEAAELALNVGSTLSLLKLCVKENVKRLIFISSASVYGIQNKALIDEYSPTNPISSHGISKLTIEKYLQLYQYHHKLDCKILRLSNPYGPRQNLLGRQGFIAIALGKILSGEQIPIRGDGSTVRDYIYIEDVCSALNALCHVDSDEILFNIASEVGYSLNDVVAKISELTGKHIEVKKADSRNVDIPISVLDCSKARHLIGFNCKYTLADGLLAMLKHHKIDTVI